MNLSLIADGHEIESHHFSLTFLYNSSDLFPFPPLEELIPISLFYTTVFLAGLAGNMAVLLVVCSTNQNTPLDNCLISLTLADLCVILFCVPIRCARWFSYTWIYGNFLCKAVHYVQNTSMAASTYTITAIAVSRYQATFHSLEIRSAKSRNRMRLILLSCWMFAVLFASPTLYFQSLVEVPRSTQHFWCMKSFRMRGFDGAAVAYEFYFFIALFIVPISAIAFAYGRISDLLRQRSLRVDSTRHELEDDKDNGHTDYELVAKTKSMSENAAASPPRPLSPVRKLPTPTPTPTLTPIPIQVPTMKSEKAKNRNIIRLLMATIIAFVICHAPLQIDNILQAFGVLPRINPQPLKAIRMVTTLLSSINSSVNPLIYCFVSPKFRQRMKLGLLTLIRHKRSKSRSTFTILSRFANVFSPRPAAAAETEKIKKIPTRAHPHSRRRRYQLA